ncbi:MAG: hypothetical protein M3Y59_05500, partial [Myxococcota bacterium]|nr:hypothetical protein [Myxococcota bacterium]
MIESLFARVGFSPNDSQRQAIEHLDGPLFLVAGPGSGSSENDQDVVISGRARGSHGKGVRAITRAAFNLALLRLCIEDERPFPN